MVLEGQITKGDFWVIEIPDLHLATQGESREDAFSMLNYLLIDLFKLEDTQYIKILNDQGGNDFLVSFSEDLLPMILRTLREDRKITIEEMTKALGTSSRSIYARYESGERQPTITNLRKALRATGYDLMIKKVESRTF